jgi:phospholipid-binding lipoprotein MlaA
VRWRNVGTVVRIVDKRAQLLDASNLLEDIALDKYDFVRDAYLQSRQAQIVGDKDDSKTDHEHGAKEGVVKP